MENLLSGVTVQVETTVGDPSATLFCRRPLLTVILYRNAKKKLTIDIGMRTRLQSFGAWSTVGMEVSPFEERREMLFHFQVAGLFRIHSHIEPSDQMRHR